MIGKEFEKFWKDYFNQTIPLNYLFKEVYRERWLRIHSLPQSKRYPDNEIEMNIILQRQNQIISDFYNENEEIYLVMTNIIHKNEKHELISFYPNLNFERSYLIELEKHFSNNFNNDEILDVFVCKNRWNINSYDEILKDIANDISRAFFISLNNKTIVSPYDGGIDIILNSETEKSIFREKYKEWISKRKDEL